MNKHCSLFLFASLLAPLAPAGEPAPERLPDGIIVSHEGTFLRVQVCGDDIIRVACSKDRAFFTHPSLMTMPRPGPAPEWDLVADGTTATVRTARLQARVDLATATVSLLDTKGNPVLEELAGARMLEPAEVQGKGTLHIRQAWASPPDEALYGLGENQLGLLNLKGHDLDLWQHNGTVAVPFLISSRGYGVL